MVVRAGPRQHLVEQIAQAMIDIADSPEGKVHTQALFNVTEFARIDDRRCTTSCARSRPPSSADPRPEASSTPRRPRRGSRTPPGPGRAGWLRVDSGVSAHIAFHDVEVTYPGGLKALKGVTLEVPRGEFVVIVGLSGAGKSTLIRTVNNLVVPSRGDVTIDGASVTQAQGEGCGRCARTSA
jgi:ABC-type multidrug transport system fused ATPase/permease subunit